MAAALPSDLETLPGYEDRFIKHDQSGYIHFPKMRGNIVRSMKVSSFTGGVNPVLTEDQLMTIMQVNSASTITNMTLPSSLLIARYLSKIADMKPYTPTIGSIDPRQYWIELYVQNDRAATITITQGDANTTFGPTVATTITIPAASRTKLSLVPLLGGVAPTFAIYAAGGF